MNIVLTTVVTDQLETLEAHLAFHLNAGVNFILVSARGSEGETDRLLEPYAEKGYLRSVPVRGDAANPFTELARIAVAEHAADWVIPSSPAEFWWPRGESLSDVLAVIPPRYAVVQALVRAVVGARHGGFFADEMTARTSLLTSGASGSESPQRLLRPIYRAERDPVIDPEDWTLGGRRVPLRAWYPVEVYDFAVGTSEAEDPDVDTRIASGELVVDLRLREALRRLRKEDGHFALPTEGSRLVFPAPTVVDDASYAVECAAVGEVDLVRLDAQIRELELRIAALEARLWPRVQRIARRLARRPR